MATEHMVGCMYALLMQFLAVGLWTSHLTSLSLCFLIYETDKNSTVQQVCCGDEMRWCRQSPVTCT